jgi:hypothetical protein
MKKPVNRSFYRTTAGLLMLVGFVISARAQTTPHVHTERCATSAVEQLRQLRNPNRRVQAEALERLIQQRQQNPNVRLADDNTVYRIPVVVHVIHNNSSNFVGGTNNPNISDDQIRSQIRVLNEDYRRQPGTNGYNTSPIGSDTGIEFFLANTDPQGQPTNGITRHYYNSQTQFDPYLDADLQKLSTISYWPSDRYLNIWVTTLISPTIGFAQLPTAADTLQGLVRDSDERIDGIVISYAVFGANACTSVYQYYCQGRTTTHEVGHWLGLKHPNGDLFCGDDFVADTPPVEQLNTGTNCGPIYSECVPGRRTRNLTENYMDYSPDACMNMFTVNQRSRMRAVLEVSPRRYQLIQSVSNPLGESEQLTITMAPNPAYTEAVAEIRFQGAKLLVVEVFDVSGRRVLVRDLFTTISTRVSFSVGNFPTGMYIVRATAGSEKASTRLVVH